MHVKPVPGVVALMSPAEFTLLSNPSGKSTSKIALVLVHSKVVFLNVTDGSLKGRDPFRDASIFRLACLPRSTFTRFVLYRSQFISLSHLPGERFLSQSVQRKQAGTAVSSIVDQP